MVATHIVDLGDIVLDQALVDTIDTNLQDIVSPLLQRLANAQIILTPQEIQVAALVKEGKSTKEIADILTVSETTVSFHRKNLRDKFGIKGKQANLTPQQARALSNLVKEHLK